eukprot:188463-Hanusia_phi.AAC.1
MEMTDGYSEGIDSGRKLVFAKKTVNFRRSIVVGLMTGMMIRGKRFLIPRDVETFPCFQMIAT